MNLFIKNLHKYNNYSINILITKELQTLYITHSNMSKKKIYMLKFSFGKLIHYIYEFKWIHSTTKSKLCNIK